jgi:tetratricopeptide (TPR) repeat protein
LALSPQEVFSVSAASVAALEVLDEAGKQIGVYSATQIDARRFVSVCDVLDVAHAFRLSLNSAVFDGKITARDRERNLCLIEVERAGSRGITRQRQAPIAGSRVFAVSNALGLGVGISEGVISGIRHFPNGDYIQFTAPISPGSEGGALVDDQGQLLGIVDYRRRDGQNVNFASFAKWIDEVEKRSADNAEQLKRFDAATALLQQQKWRDLAALSSDWLRRQPDNSDALRFSVAAAKGLKNVDAELSGWKELRRVSPTQPDVGIGLGQALLASGRVKEALELGKQLVAEHREFAKARWLLARAYQLSGAIQDAEASYKEAIALDPWLLEAYPGLAGLAQARGDSATAISIWSRLSGLYPDVLGPRIGLVQAYLAAGKAARAYSALEKLPEKDKDGAVAWYWRGVVLARLERPDAAVQAYRKSLARQIEGADMVWAGIGFAMAEMKRYPEAIAAFESAIKTGPANEDWRYQLAINLKDGGRPGEALPIMASLIAKAPERAHYWRQQGFVLSVLGRPLDAIPAMERSLQIEPKQPKLWGALIEASQAAGRRKEARDAYQKLRAIDAKAAEDMYRTHILPYEDMAP